jgi:hypothetical protein
VKSSIFFGNLVKNLAYEEDDSNTDTQKNDDGSFDEAGWLMKPENKNRVTDVGLGCFDPIAPRFRPAVAQTGNAATPPDDGFFDPTASYVGAFRDEKDDWATGNWVVFSDR